MKKVLVYNNRKLSDSVIWDASDFNLAAAAFLGLFNMLDRHWYMYEDAVQENMETFKLVEKARSGNRQAAYNLLYSRNGREYESWSIVGVEKEEIVNKTDSSENDEKFRKSLQFNWGVS